MDRNRLNPARTGAITPHQPLWPIALRLFLLSTALLVGTVPVLARPVTAQSPTAGHTTLPKQESRQTSDALEDPHYIRALPSAEVLIDAGHGGVDGGAVHDQTLEKDINLAISKKLYLLLRASGVRAVLNRDGDYALSDDNRWHGSRSRHQRDLSQRSQLSREIDTQIVVSLHVNWSSQASVKGPLVLYQPEGQSALLARCIQDALNQQHQLTKSARLGKPFYLLKSVRTPAVIVEMGFISNAQDRQMLTNPRTQLQVADAIASGVRNYILLR